MQNETRAEKLHALLCDYQHGFSAERVLRIWIPFVSMILSVIALDQATKADHLKKDLVTEAASLVLFSCAMVVLMVVIGAMTTSRLRRNQENARLMLRQCAARRVVLVRHLDFRRVGSIGPAISGRDKWSVYEHLESGGYGESCCDDLSLTMLQAAAVERLLNADSETE